MDLASLPNLMVPLAHAGPTWSVPVVVAKAAGLILLGGAGLWAAAGECVYI